jgi:hypothetical protein
LQAFCALTGKFSDQNGRAVSSAVLTSPARPRLRNRRRRTAIATAAGAYLAAYGAGVLGLLALFAHTGRVALLLMAAALALGVVTGMLLAVDKRLRPREAPRLRRRLA